MKKLLKTVLAILVLSCISLSALFIFRDGLRSYLEKSDKANANMLIIESWLPDPAVDLAMNEIKTGGYDFVVTTGIQSSELDFCMVAENGYLIFYPGFKTDLENENNSHIIEIVARSKMGGKYCSDFNLYINDSLITDFTADEKPRKYGVMWASPLSEIDSIMVQFTNDYLDESGDRNLYVKEIVIDNEHIIQYQFNSVFDIGKIGGNNRIVNDYRSHPEILRNRLIKNGLDSLKVVAVTGGKTKINRTLTGALAFRDWLRKSGYQVSGVNIITMSIHARRTWITYKKVLDKSIETGIISLPNFESPDKKRSELSDTIIEFLDLIYYRIILILY